MIGILGICACVAVLVVKVPVFVAAYFQHKRACDAAAAYHRRHEPAPDAIMKQTWRAFDAAFKPAPWIFGAAIAGIVFAQLLRAGI